MAFELIDEEEIKNAGETLTEEMIIDDDIKLSDVDKARDRVPIHESRNIMTIEKEPGYVYRWVIDRPGRIERFKRAGYELVIDPDLEVGDQSIDGNRQPGAVVSIVGNEKYGESQYLMKIKKEFWEQDQAAKQRLVDESEEEIIRKTTQPGHYGSFKETVLNRQPDGNKE